MMQKGISSGCANLLTGVQGTTILVLIPTIPDPKQVLVHMRMRRHAWLLGDGIKRYKTVFN